MPIGLKLSAEQVLVSTGASSRIGMTGVCRTADEDASLMLASPNGAKLERIRSKGG